MLYKAKTEKGNILIDKAVIAAIVAKAAEQFHGKVIISNYKSKGNAFSLKKTVSDDVNSIEITLGDRGLDIKVYIVVRFGTSIGMVTNTLINTIYEDVKTYTGIEADSVSVVVTGIVSKNIARRNIEVRRH